MLLPFALNILLNPRPTDDVSSLMKEVRAAYAQTQSATLKIKVLAGAPGGKAFAGTASVNYQSPKKLHLEIEGRTGGKITVICDGENIWTSDFRGRHSLSPFSIHKLSESHPLNLETICLYDAAHEFDNKDGMRGSQLSVAKDVLWNKKKWVVLKEINIRDDVAVEYFIDPATFLIWRVLGIDRHAKKVYVDTQVVTFAKNQKLPEALFIIEK